MAGAWNAIGPPRRGGARRIRATSRREQRARRGHRHDAARRKRRIRRACRTPNYARPLAQVEGARRGTAIPRRSACTAARAAATSPSSSACGRVTPRYNADPADRGAPAGRHRRATSRCASPISDPYARFQNAERLKRDADGEEPHDVLQAVGDDLRRQPAADPRSTRKGRAGSACSSCRGRSTTTCLPASPGEVRQQSYSAAGGGASFEVLRGCEHEWVATPGPQTDARARWSRVIAQLASPARPSRFTARSLWLKPSRSTAGLLQGSLFALLCLAGR